MKIVVTGAGGQLGMDLVPLLTRAGHEVLPLHTAHLDFAEPGTVAAGIRGHRADWVVNCAAYTAVDKAEEQPELAHRINAASAGELARGVVESDGRLLHVSTDFVFDGTKSSPYGEDAPGHPLGAYGQSKWEGEQQVRQHLPQAIILRTAWVYGSHGNNFVKTILRLAGEREQLRVVDDQVGTPSWTMDIAHAILTLVQAPAMGTYHFTNEGVASWYDFAKAIVEEARALATPLALQELCPIPTSGYPTPATRPAYSVLSKQKIRPLYGKPIPHWRDSLRAMLAELINEESLSPEGSGQNQTSPLPRGRGPEPNIPSLSRKGQEQCTTASSREGPEQSIPSPSGRGPG